jgi:hypothetical protein
MMRTSSTKRRCRILMVLKTLIPIILPFVCLDLRRRLKASIVKMKKRGERGQPSLSPLPIRKKEEGSPLTKIARFALVTQPMVHLIIGWLKPI